jgi:iron uptake system component EfeO
MIRLAFSSLLAIATTALLAGCGSDDSVAGAKTLKIKLTDAGCVPQNAKVAAGPVNFDVTNDGADNVTELELLDGDKILGEKENLSDGLSGSFSVNLQPGKYTISCPNADTDKGTLTVTGSSQASSGPGDAAAVKQYRAYVERNADQLVARTAPFVAAVKAGDVAKAKALYAPARIPYERIEPVAESFGPLDPEIDARINDVPPNQFGGFHRIEKGLWVDDSTAGLTPFATKLLVDVKRLQKKVQTVVLQAAQIANGANELLGEVSASKITGEEERYSHIDLVDFEANVEGAQAAFDSVKPILVKVNPSLTKEIDARFDSVYAALKPYRQGTGFVSYTELTKSDTRKLARSIDALAEPLSLVAAQIV